jgi:hypothetical protein
MACYSGPIPIKDDERVAIWRWAKANGIDAGLPIEKVGDAINQHFFNGHARPEWITDILSGRKTPFKRLADDAWRKQYNRRTIVQKATELSRTQAMGPAGKILQALWALPRSVSVAGHGFVFPLTHAGDLAFRPESWGTFVKGVLDTYHASFSKAHAAKMLDSMERRELFGTALRSGLDVGPKSHPVGLITNIFGSGMAKRGWDMLTVMRYELWESQMHKFLKPDMSGEEVADVAKNLANWANHATGSGKGPVANLGGLLFGPKLTQAKLNRLTIDPAETIRTFSNWDRATAGEKAVAWTRLSGAAQYLLTGVGFLAVNQGVLTALGVKEKNKQINFTDPNKADFLAFKLGGVEGYIPGLHTEIKTLSKILATAFMSRKELRGESRAGHMATIMGQYGMGKVTPAVERGQELLFGQNWRGQPVPWSSDKGTKKNPRLDWGEYAGSIGPIPLEGPIGYVYEHLKQNGASSKDAMSITKGLIITGLGATGVHVQEEK